MPQLDKYEKRILKYFESPTLCILDPPKKQSKYNKKYYLGVTIPYIYKYVIKKEISFDRFIFIILKLKKEDKIRSLYCGYVLDVVIESPLFDGHWNYSFIAFNRKIYKYYVKWRKKIQ